MEILPYDPDMAAGIARCYNDLVAPVPHCPPVPAVAFSDLATLGSAATHDDAMLVAREPSGALVGFAHVALDANANDTGLIRFLAYPATQRLVGQALLEAADNWERGRGRTKVAVGRNSCMYPFYHLPYARLSERIAHVHALLGIAGYGVEWSENFLEWRDFDPPAAAAPTADITIAVEWHSKPPSFLEPARVQPGVVVRALRDGEQVGVCITTHLPREYREQEISEWCYCHELEVEQHMRGRGLGKLLLLTSLAEMREAGCKHAALAVAWNNHLAALLYTTLGFRFLDRTASYAKQATTQETA